MPLCLLHNCRKAKQPLRSLSLLEPIPVNRTCEQMGVAVHYCICEREWLNVEVESPLAQQAVAHLIAYINDKLLKQVAKHCHTLALGRITSVRRSRIDGLDFIRLNVFTKPNNATYEAMLTYDVTPKEQTATATSTSSSSSSSSSLSTKLPHYSFKIHQSNSISRTNAYAQQSTCLQYIEQRLTADLRIFCLCKKS